MSTRNGKHGEPGFYVYDWMFRLGMTGREMFVYAMIFSLNEYGHGCFASLDGFGKRLNIDKSSVSKVITSLKKKGLVKQDGDSRFGSRKLIAIRPTSGTASSTAGRQDSSLDDQVPPTLDDVREYCRGRNSSIDPEEFFNHYESNGWMMGRSPMVSWKSAVACWEKYKPNNSRRATGQPPSKAKDDVFTHNLRVMREMNSQSNFARFLMQDVDEL